MGSGQGRKWDRRDGVIAVGIVAALAFVLIELTGSNIDEQAAETLTTALAMVLFTAFGATGVALVRWQPRFALFGVVTAILSPLGLGATVASTWSSGPFLLGFGFYGTSGTVGAITDFLAIAAAGACVLLATHRPGEDGATQAVRVAALGGLALFVGLAILNILDDGVEISARAYAIIATVYVVATAVSLVLRLLPVSERSATVAS